MSLINDALRKARQAAAEHEDQRNAGRASKAYPSHAARSGIGTGTVLLVATAAAVAGAAAVWWFTIQTAPPGTSTLESAAAPASAASSHQAPSLQAGDAGEPSETAPSTEDAGIADATEATPAGPTPRPHDPVLQQAPPPSDPVSEKPAATSAPAAEPDSADRVFVMDADLGYATLSLGYIVFRPVRPFAEINGVDVYEGSEVEGFTVEKIEIDRVVLKDSRGPVVLRVP